MWSNLTAKLNKKSSKAADQLTDKQSAGNRAERIACEYLKQQKLNPIAQNVLYRQGEIDIIALDGEQLVFVEVRYRKQASHGGALASVDYRKQQKIMKAAQLYLQQTYGNRPPSCRFDVIGITGLGNQTDIQWIKNAFY